jgi:hypothetical protein
MGSWSILVPLYDEDVVYALKGDQLAKVCEGCVNVLMYVYKSVCLCVDRARVCVQACAFHV